MRRLITVVDNTSVPLSSQLTNQVSSPIIQIAPASEGVLIRAVSATMADNGNNSALVVLSAFISVQFFSDAAGNNLIDGVVLVPTGPIPGGTAAPLSTGPVLNDTGLAIGGYLQRSPRFRTQVDFNGQNAASLSISLFARIDNTAAAAHIITTVLGVDFEY